MYLQKQHFEMERNSASVVPLESARTTLSDAELFRLNRQLEEAGVESMFRINNATLVCLLQTDGIAVSVGL